MFDEGSGSLLLIVCRCKVTVALEAHISRKKNLRSSFSNALEPLRSAVNRHTGPVMVEPQSLVASVMFTVERWGDGLAPCEELTMERFWKGGSALRGH